MNPLEATYGETLLHAENVTVRRGENVILRDLDLTVRDVRRPGRKQGQVVALLGPSGMGKTTLFNVLSGLEKPTQGAVYVTEKRLPVQRGMVGVVAQHYPLFAHRTVLSNLAVAGREAGLSGRDSEAKARDLLAKFGLSDQSGKYPVQLSGGQRQRVAIAQQFMCSDLFLLMDEPFSGLDMLALGRLCEFINAIVATDDLKTIIVVTHDIRAALIVADTVWLMGRDRDADGEILPGARIKATFDLVARGLAWQPDLHDKEEFRALTQEVRGVFPTL